MDIQQFEGRKRDHLRYSLDPAHQASGFTGLDQIRLVHEALPELDFDEVRLDALCLGTSLATPFYVAGMTAGHADASELNRRLARACAARGWAMGVGSQRRELESDPALTKESTRNSVDEWARLREEAPGLVLFANIGLSQAIGAPVAHLRRLVESIGATALCIHLNALQEAFQPEGTPRFRGGLQRIRELVSELGTPVVIKETGCGLSAGTSARLAEAGVAAIDVAGLGGTHWGRIEGARAEGQDPVRAAAARTFAGWGEPTAEAVAASARIVGSRVELWASGGVRNGLDAAKLIALGAHRVGYAKPALEAALAGDAALERWMGQQEFELKTALFCTGSASCESLRRREGVWKASAR